ncbi:hypothetical protein [Fimbriiglobus ruber]|uniref:hypothetical protein n=1 Tax=Fimbriiglobus ruber TaxID=1908690 RepID=UPI00117B83E4|nr:hypothetical protein [Fimbriiglobus ruber]
MSKSLTSSSGNSEENLGRSNSDGADCDFALHFIFPSVPEKTCEATATELPRPCQVEQVTILYHGNKSTCYSVMGEDGPPVAVSPNHHKILGLFLDKCNLVYTGKEISEFTKITNASQEIKRLKDLYNNRSAKAIVMAKCKGKGYSIKVVSAQPGP